MNIFSLFWFIIKCKYSYFVSIFIFCYYSISTINWWCICIIIKSMTFISSRIINFYAFYAKIIICRYLYFFICFLFIFKFRTISINFKWRRKQVKIESCISCISTIILSIDIPFSIFISSKWRRKFFIVFIFITIICIFYSW